MKKGLSLLTSLAMILSLTACGDDGEEEIVYEESPFPVPAEYTIPSGDTAPAFYSNVLTEVAEWTVTLEGEEIYNENGELIDIPDEGTSLGIDTEDLSKAEKKAIEAEEALLQAAYDLLDADLTREKNKLSSIQLVKIGDPTEKNALLVSEATEAYNLAVGEGGAEAEETEGATEENLSTVEVDPLEALIAELDYEPFVYTYDVTTTGSTGGQATAYYVEYMQKQGYKIIDPFHPVNNEYYEMLTPDFTQRAGTVALAKKASGTDKIFMIMVDWNYYGSVVLVYEEEGTLWIAPKKSTQAKTSITINEAVNYLETRTPSQLGLDGTSMEEYSVFTSEGLVIVNGVTYRQFTITKNPVNGNGSVFGGNYLIDTEGNTYAINQLTGTITPLQLTNIFDTLN